MHTKINTKALDRSGNRTEGGTVSSNAYDFSQYHAALAKDWWQDDPLLERWLAGPAVSDHAREWLARLGERAATRWRIRADCVEQRENLPRIAASSPYNQPCEEIWLPAETRESLAEIHGSGLWKAALEERARYAAIYLANQNGEAGVTCSLACTDGMARLLRRFSDDERSREVIDLLEVATPDRWIHGAQFVTEIQGGSDAATNEVLATPSEGSAKDRLPSYRLSGQKWFCSNLTADYWLVTARLPDGPRDHRGVGLFCVPRLREDRPNGYRIVRLKDKLGTRALPTAELELCDAYGWAVGPLDAGLRNMVAVVLTTSRVHNVVAAAAFVRAAHRHAHAYAHFRHAFGKSLAEHPLVAHSLERLSLRADRAAAGAFACVDSWTWALAHPEDLEANEWARVLVSLAKAVGTRQAPQDVYQAMMILGGNGIEERFSPIPRLWRDAAILETWEGPYTLLLMNALRDLVRLGVKGREARFLELGLGDSAGRDLIDPLSQILNDPESTGNIEAWGELAPRIYERFEAVSLERVDLESVHRGRATPEPAS